MKSFYCCCSFLIILYNLVYSQIKKQDSILIFKADSIYNYNEELNGSITLITSSHKSEVKEFTLIKNEILLDYGTYPFEIDFKMKVETLLKDSKLEENINEMDVSFDYHPENLGNGRLLETFIFAHHYNDEYLDIKTKYELGGGFVINFWTPEILTKNGSKASDMINEDNIMKKNSTHDSIVSILKKRKIPEDKADIIYKANQFNIKSNSKWRYAILLGIFYEIEHICPSDTIIGSPDNFFDISNLLKWEIRPTIEYRPNDFFSIRLESYFKLPFENLKSTFIKDDLTPENRINLFIDLPVSCKFKLSKGLEFSIEYRFVYDNIPQQKVIFWEGTDRLISASGTHHNFDAKFCFKF